MPAGMPAPAKCFDATRVRHHIIALGAQFPPVVTLLGSVGVFFGGAICSWLFLRCRSVWRRYVSHVIADLPFFILSYHLIFGAAGPG
jgi:hypothetical protein